MLPKDVDINAYREAVSYEDAVLYIDNVPKFTSKTSLEHTELILEAMGHPEKDLQVLHVAGTNGKGSVCADLDAMLRAAGYRTGLFTSPHLIRINERFRIDGRDAGDDEFLKAFREVMKAAEQVMKEGEAHPTYFEILFLMGIWLFHEAQVDYTILEVGMGGRLDATNVIRKPLVSVITSVSLDHMRYLGSTVSEIAGEKAGIIKPGVPVVYDAGRADVSAVIEKRARETGSPCFPLKPERARIRELTEKGAVFSFYDETGRETILQIPQIAPYQVRNAALAYFVLRVLKDQVATDIETCTKGLASVSWPCRMQQVEPGIFIDGAHNPDGIACFLEAAEVFHREKEITLLFSAVNDKDYKAMVRELASLHPEQVITTRIPDARGVPEEELAQLFVQEGCQAVFSESVPARAYEMAAALRGDGIVFCVGSLYLAGELLKGSRRTAEQ